MANESFANTLLVQVDGNPLPADVAALLTHAYVEDSRNLPDLFVLRFRDPQHVVLAKARLTVGATVVLTVQTAESGGPQPLMSGEVTAVELELDRTGTVTQVRGLDPTHRLFRGRRVAAYPNMTVADVVRKVAERAGLTAGRIDPVPGVGGQRDTQLSQDNVSDWEFLTRLADLVGAQLNVVDGALDFRLPEAPAGAPDTTARATTEPLVLEAHRNLVSLRACVSAAEQVPSVEARGWDVEHKQEVSATATPRTAGTETPAVDPVKLANTFGAPPFLAADPSWHTPAVVKAAAEAVAGQLGGACTELTGLAKGNPKLRAGAAVALANVGDPFSGKYTLTATRHLFGEHDGYTTEFTAAGRQERSLYGLVRGATGADRRTGGLVPAIVSDVRDPLNLGRVKLTFPWLAKDFTSGWARTVQAGAGKGRGALVLPEVGDEVLVGFAGGDLDEPYVLGGLHNGKDPAPTVSTDPVDRSSGEIAVRAFVSRTGHRVELVENDGIIVATGDGKLTVRLDRKKGVVEIKGGSGVTIDAGTGPLELKGQKVSVSAMSEAELTANGQVTVRGGVIKLN
ncbi:VgrG-related protein [Plantactinospora sp. GCM10030261]|uniref:VgrG-related protein n=1 Tax=Plantactinospora sp. GCM10030261 TaxID=3273420 RepID=UPI0036124550